MFVLVGENGRYGHLTWEWKKGIRSYLHPVLFAVLYKVLSILGLDTPWFMVIISFSFPSKNENCDTFLKGISYGISRLVRIMILILAEMTEKVSWVF